MERLTTESIYDIFSDWAYCTRTRRDICAFLKYAYVYKIISTNLAVIVPTTRRHYAVPSVYTPEEVEKILASVDRNTATGKRNYAILLLAARLGLRRSDIAALTFDSLKSTEIVFVQVKIKRKQSLIFLQEVKTVIDDYVDNSRQDRSKMTVIADYVKAIIMAHEARRQRAAGMSTDIALTKTMKEVSITYALPGDSQDDTRAGL